MAGLGILCSNPLTFKNKITKVEHKKMFCGPSKILKNISWSINICLKYFMTPTKTSGPPLTYLMHGSLNVVRFKFRFTNTIVNFRFSSIVVMFVWYIMLFLRQFSCGRHCGGILMQLQDFLPISGDGYNIFLLCSFVIDFIFGRQL